MESHFGTSAVVMTKLSPAQILNEMPSIAFTEEDNTMAKELLMNWISEGFEMLELAVTDENTVCGSAGGPASGDRKGQRAYARVHGIHQRQTVEIHYIDIGHAGNADGTQIQQENTADAQILQQGHDILDALKARRVIQGIVRQNVPDLQEGPAAGVGDQAAVKVPFLLRIMHIITSDSLYIDHIVSYIAHFSQGISVH